jgi:hypothetical protein
VILLNALWVAANIVLLSGWVAPDALGMVEDWCTPRHQ